MLSFTAVIDFKLLSSNEAIRYSLKFSAELSTTTLHSCLHVALDGRYCTEVHACLEAYTDLKLKRESQ